jgi:hypothetical protein
LNLDSNEHWYNWLHIVALLDHLLILKIVFFGFVALLYPFIWIRNRYVNAESTKWTNVALITEKIGTLVGRTLFILAIAFILFQFFRWLLK